MPGLPHDSKPKRARTEDAPPATTKRKRHTEPGDHLTHDRALFTGLIAPALTHAERAHVRRCSVCCVYCVRYIELEHVLHGQPLNAVIRKYLTIHEAQRITHSTHIDKEIETRVLALKPRRQRSGYQLYLKELKLDPSLPPWHALGTKKTTYLHKAASLAQHARAVRERLTPRLRHMLTAARRQPNRVIPPRLRAHIAQFKPDENTAYKQYLKNVSICTNK